ncbi:MAG: Fe-S oxidoreductase, partial [Pseudonocardiaceae bacterium]
MAVRLVIGLGLTILTLVFAGRRVWWLYTLIRSGQPTGGRAADVGARLRTQLVEVFGQRRLLRWTIPGLAHFFTFWGFVVLITVYIEAYGVLFDEQFAIPLIGHSPVLGFLQDFIALAVLASIITFAIMRVRQAPERRQRASRFYGSHTGGAWLILFMIFNVIWTLFLFRGTEVNNGTFPYRSGAFASDGAAALLAPLGAGTNQILETVGLLLHIGVMLAFLIIVLYSKHLHIFIAPINVAAKRMPKALGPLLPMESGGKE